MSRPPRAREIVLDAFEQILSNEGARAATMDAVARQAGVSKGGLLYHFASKEALESAMVDRLLKLVADDLAELESAEEGSVTYFLRTSAAEDDNLDRAMIAVARLAQSGSEPARDAIRTVRLQWEDALRPHTRDALALDLVMLLADGLSFNSTMGGDAQLSSVPHGEALDTLIERVVGLTTW
ncbi:transcriptional regulator [Microbacterium mangrovi]|uniref:Transcriptional regulator n=1 Tax=Microbacterium mangrovi TaxID=1348253 RepID=A0A0B2A307_9MICO|nr:TetR/AcrR family transcriptional regulator [Microbacterium mangrovi]KHK97425.1 transcriptional regulator [Microbacterium mangrovi]